MATSLKFSANINTFNACADRYVLSGYGERLTTDQLIAAATKVPGLTGVELVGHVARQRRQRRADPPPGDATPASSSPASRPTSGPRASGAGAASRPTTRRSARDAIHEVKKSMEWAKQLSCEVVDLWFGQDGYDYPFQADYPLAWDRIIAGTIECAEHVPDVKLVLEYKPKEPRTHCFIATVGKTLLLIDKVNRPNVGAMVDIGHALMAYENVAESAALLQYFGNKLMYMHFNDNWRLWDDDMTVGSVHTIEMLELLYWLDRMNYNGWYALDIFPYRENGIRAATESIKWIQGLHGLLDKIGRDRIAEVIACGDAMEATAMIREALLG